VRVVVGIVLGLIAAATASATTRTVAFPLVVDYPILEAALRRDLGMREGASLDLWGTPGDCHWAVVDDLALGGAGGKIRVTTRGSAVVGFRLLWFCVSPLAWQGALDLTMRPEVGADWQLRFTSLEIEARDADGRPDRMTNSALQLARGRLEERLRAFHFDLAPPAEEAQALLRASAPPDRAAPALAAIATLRPIETAAADEGVRVRIAMDVPEVAGSPAAAEPALSEDEAKRWDDRIDRWDAFLAFAVKTLGAASADQGARSELLAILLDGRRELVETLRQGPVPGTDPVRNLFLSSWDRLRVQTRRAVRQGELGDRAYRFVTFLAAGDALAALDQAGPGLGLEISADGLRRLARVLDPERTGDPIAVSDAPDPELRKLFGFQDPATDLAPSPPTTTGSTTTVPTTTVPPTTLPLSWLWSPAAAEAATVDLAAISRRLDRWVPGDTELDDYRGVVDQMLATVAAHRESRVAARFGPVYRSLVPAVAWQESCWRQFVDRGGTVTFLLSATGDVGIMQVNRRVWRGFFDVRKLEWDAVYNAAAGAEILVQLLDRFGAREGGTVLANAARATYSAYNGGPGAHRRYRSPKASPLGRAIDGGFFEKYQLVAAGKAGAGVLCM